jgi:hypothetical protein
MVNNPIIYDNLTFPVSSLNITLSGEVLGSVSNLVCSPSGGTLNFFESSGVTYWSYNFNILSDYTEFKIYAVDDLGNETLVNIKSVYYERDAFYLLHLPATNVIYYFDLRRVLENGASRTTEWTELPYFAYCTTEDRRLLFGVDGGIAQYAGYQDNGVSYRMSYYTPNSDIGAPASLKFLKRAKLIAIGNATQDFVIKYAYDYSGTYYSRFYFNTYNQVHSEYNIAEYGIGEYTGGLNIITAKVNLGGSGEVIKFGVETVVNGAPVSIQKADIYVTTGKIS